MELRGSDLLKFTGYYVYVWRREGTPLYVGMSGNILHRLSRHNVIGVRDTLRPDDILELISCRNLQDAAKRESEMISRLAPKYNVTREKNPPKPYVSGASIRARAPREQRLGFE